MCREGMLYLLWQVSGVHGRSRGEEMGKGAQDSRGTLHALLACDAWGFNGSTRAFPRGGGVVSRFLSLGLVGGEWVFVAYRSKLRHQ
mmetsp:Transcript_27096/g.68286  ORF Transcript_27096/g.68286 Transcript_27096/m.68286 type:complete len:87 (+) Transcript_27096:695-955(+)